MMIKHSPLLVAAMIGAGTLLSAQQPAPQRVAGTLKEGVTAVLVDVVVRDKRGQPVRDLTAADFEVFEDGQRQTVGSFTPFIESAGGTAATTAPGVAAPAAPSAGSAQAAADTPPVMAIVFDRLTPEARQLAVQSAQRYLGTKEEAPNYIGIFGLDLSLRPLVPFTRNAVALRQGLARIASGGTANFGSAELAQQRSTADAQAASASQTAAAGAAAGGPGASAAIGTSPAAAQLAQMASNMVRDFERMTRDQQGYAATDGLFAIVRTLGRLPGRKSLVLFSEGIAIPPAVQRFFSGVIDAANRANVSIYTMDAAGLRAESDQARIRDSVNAAAGFAINGGFAGGGGGGAFTKELEANEYNLRSDPAYGLGTLATDTGGVLFNRSNNLAEGFRQIDDDLRNYYLLGYTPSNESYDGKFRRIEVKVTRPGVVVAARKGYFAVRNAGGTPVNEWEAPALGALAQKPVPNAFPVRAGALLFPERGRPGLVPVVVEVKTAPLTFQPAADGKSYTSDFTVLVQFVDSQNETVRKVSQHYDIRGELSQIDRAKLGEVVFYRESELPPGVYSMETVVHDALSGKSSVRFGTVEVPRHEEGRLRMSSLVLIKRGEQVPEKDRRPENPMLVNGVALSPNLGDPISKTAKEIAFYFAMYPASGGGGPNVTIELLQNGKPAVQLPMPVPPADASGRVQQVGRLPLEAIAPGTYELRAVVKQGDQLVTRSIMLRVAD